MNNPITTHILNTALGKPAADIAIQLFILQGKEWLLLSSAMTNQDGRIDDWHETGWYQGKALEELFATYKIVFSLEDYWEKQSIDGFYPSAEISFKVQDVRHHHIPLLLAPYGYSTYRGS